MGKWLPFVLLLSSYPLFGQIDTVEVTEAESKKFRYQRRAIFAGVASDQTPVFGGLEPALTLTAGIQYRDFILGVMWSDFDKELGQRIIFPNFFDLRFRHAGIFGGYQVWHTRRMGANLLLQFTRGDVVWTSVATQEDTFRDEVNFIGTQAQFEYNPLRFLGVFINAGYRYALDVDLASTTASDLSGLNVTFGVKAGFSWARPHMIITDETNNNR